MHDAPHVLMAIGCFCFILAAIGFPGVPSEGRSYSLGWLGAFFVTLGLLFK